MLESSIELRLRDSIISISECCLSTKHLVLRSVVECALSTLTHQEFGRGSSKESQVTYLS